MYKQFENNFPTDTHYELRKYCESKIGQIQNGGYEGRDNFPTDMTGEIAKDKWDDPLFSYGMEYGYLHAMVELQRMLGLRKD